MIGKTISHYKILEKLGEGGMGVVYKAEDTKLKRTVALKFLSSQALGGEEDKARFIHEAQAAASLSHPNICTVYEIDEFGGQSFIAMEYIEGQTLKARMEPGPLKLDQAIETAIQVGRGLQRAHEKGIVHRDVKPANVMVAPDDQVKIMDFGLAKLAGRTALTRDGTTLGTIAYMSPEQARGEAVDHRTDIWSLGALLYEMVTGQKPFKSDYEPAVVYSIQNEEPEPPTALRTGVPMELERVINRCLEKKADDRYQTAGDLVSDLRRLERAAAHSRTRAVSPVGAQRGAPWIPRWAWIAGLAALAVVAVLAVRSYLTIAEKEAASQLKMLAVLPFENLGPTDDEYFADGVTDAITARLAGIHGLGVISRQSASQYKDSAKSLRQIGEELGVHYVLEGTVQRERPSDPASRVRVITQLVSVPDDTHLWADMYDEDIMEVFRVQSEIAERVALELDVKLLEPERSVLAAMATENLEAYEYYLRASDYMDRSEDWNDALEAVRLYEKAVELDPGFAAAWARLSMLQSSTYAYHGWREGIAKARDAADTALELDRELPESHLACGFVHYYGARDYDKALEQFVWARERRPTDAEAITAVGDILRCQGKWEEALDQFKMAQRMNPRDFSLHFNYLGWTYFITRQYAEAERHWNRAMSLAPGVLAPYIQRVLLHVCGDGDMEEAERLLKDALDRVDPTDLTDIILLYGLQELIRIFPHTWANTLEHASLESVAHPGSYYLARAELAAQKGQEKLAVAYYDSARVVIEAEPHKGQLQVFVESDLGLAYAGLGLKEKAIRAGRQAVQVLPVSKDAFDGVCPVLVLAWIYVKVGEYELAIDQLEFLLSIPSWVSVTSLRLDPIWDPLRDNPRFQRLLEEHQQAAL